MVTSICYISKVPQIRCSIIFWKSKFSQIVIFEDFIFTNLLHMCTQNILWAWHTSLVYLTRTITLSSAWTCRCQQSHAYFEGVPLESSLLSLGMLSIDTLACSQSMKIVLHVKTFVEIFLRMAFWAVEHLQTVEWQTTCHDLCMWFDLIIHKP